MAYYVYFVIQKRSVGGYGNHQSIYDLKVGHSKDPIKRVYSYNNFFMNHEAKLVHKIEVSSKKIACAIERGYVRCLSDISECYGDTREWFNLTDTVKEQLKKWEINHEMV